MIMAYVVFYLKSPGQSYQHLIQLLQSKLWFTQRPRWSWPWFFNPNFIGSFSGHDENIGLFSSYFLDAVCRFTFPIDQCGKCWSFQHFINFPLEEPLCGNCCQVGCTSRNCKNSPFCILCGSKTHSPWYILCPVRLAIAFEKELKLSADLSHKYPM